jgi:hypothetical protein
MSISSRGIARTPSTTFTVTCANEVRTIATMGPMPSRPKIMTLTSANTRPGVVSVSIT